MGILVCDIVNPDRVRGIVYVDYGTTAEDVQSAIRLADDEFEFGEIMAENGWSYEPFGNYEYVVW